MKKEISAIGLSQNEDYTIGEIIGLIRLNYNLSQRELARILGISKSYMNNIERDNVKKPGYLLLFNLVKEFNLTNYDKYRLFLSANYTAIEMERLGVISSAEGGEIIGYDYKDENGNWRINVRKALKDYKNNKITENEILSIIEAYLIMEPRNED